MTQSDQTDTRPSVPGKSSFTHEELLDCGHARLFGAGNAQLPLPPMLMFDRIIKINNNGGGNGKGKIIAELDVKPDLWFFECHFENDPVMPGCLGLDAMWLLVGLSYIPWTLAILREAYRGTQFTVSTWTLVMPKGPARGTARRRAMPKRVQRGRSIRRNSQS